MSNQHEAAFRPIHDAENVPTRLLRGCGIELVGGFRSQATLRHALFDFDGTLSLIREGWPEVMIPMMIEFLQETGTDESPAALREIVTRYVAELTGKQTIYQMIRLAEEVRRRGGRPLDPLAYKAEYHNRLMARIESRREALRAGVAVRETMTVPGSYTLLGMLQARGVQMYLASGTDEQYVKEEVALLGLDTYFGDHVYGALDDFRSFSKAQVIERILSENRVEAASLVGFGDGYVEIQNVRDVGGTAVAVASDEANRSGQPDAWKRARLIGAGRMSSCPISAGGSAGALLWTARRNDHAAARRIQPVCRPHGAAFVAREQEDDRDRSCLARNSAAGAAGSVAESARGGRGADSSGAGQRPAGRRGVRAHAIKNGLGPVFLGLIERGWLTHLATNGAGVIHDWEFAFQGQSCEHVGPMVAEGQFGNWQETGFNINLAFNIGAFEGRGYGESVGAMIENEGLDVPVDAELEAAVADWRRRS